MSAVCSNTIRIKNCSTCGIPFNCGDSPAGSKCWCNDFPPIFNPSDIIDCLCPSCFAAACKQKIDEYVATITPETAIGNKASLLPKTTNLVEGIDYYIETSTKELSSDKNKDVPDDLRQTNNFSEENGNYVFKAWYHLKRGHCCKNGCRHCPY